MKMYKHVGCAEELCGVFVMHTYQIVL